MFQSLLSSQEICQLNYNTPCNYFPHSSFISIQMQCIMKHTKHTIIITLLPHTHQNSLQNLQNISPNIAYMNPFYLTFQHITMMMMMTTMTKTLSLTATGPHNQSHTMQDCWYFQTFSLITVIWNALLENG